MAVLPPLEERILQSQESDADVEMSSSSASEGDTLEYNMSEDLEDSLAGISPPPSSKSEKKKPKNTFLRITKTGSNIADLFLTMAYFFIVVGKQLMAYAV
ncbi:hypothetical protein AVEN_13721-1 [Araneus ventricosus]|uniref:Uncharacterized protein n=1 Tax=Araneus ventricosus TaxID=182803 RepID=A0A4Y2TJD3_ARAVE|nr:hypothetical protein AVEN_13721-1 [Araneus ventricosus]